MASMADQQTYSEDWLDEIKLTRLTTNHCAAESVFPGSSGVSTDAFSVFILATAAPALFPRKRFRMSSFQNREHQKGEKARI